MVPAFQGREGHEQIGGSIAFVFVIEASRSSRSHRYGVAGFGGQLSGSLIQTHERSGGILVDVER